MPLFTFSDFFAGIGGMRLAFQSVKGKCVFSSEIDKFARITYEANFGEYPEGDIRQIDEESIPDHDILLAGFPCQPFSIAGVSKRKSLGKPHGFSDKERGNLFFEIARIIDAKKPSAFLLENVSHLKRHDKGKTFEKIIKILRDDLGYSIYYEIINSRWVVPQNRRRLFIVGFDKPHDFKFPDFPRKMLQIKYILERDVDPKYTLSDRLWKYLREYALKHRKKGNGFGFNIVRLDGVASTLSARYYKDGAEILIPQGENRNPRRLTPRECASLMGFPSTYKLVVSDTQAYKQFGNTVVVPVVEKIAEAMVQCLIKN
jgi:DNA (cytosine-5)-methyltransferase 1